jgi:hypothetical protein
VESLRGEGACKLLSRLRAFRRAGRRSTLRAWSLKPGGRRMLRERAARFSVEEQDGTERPASIGTSPAAAPNPTFSAAGKRRRKSRAETAGDRVKSSRVAFPGLAAVRGMAGAFRPPPLASQRHSPRRKRGSVGPACRESCRVINWARNSAASTHPQPSDWISTVRERRLVSSMLPSTATPARPGARV